MRSSEASRRLLRGPPHGSERGSDIDVAPNAGQLIRRSSTGDVEGVRANSFGIGFPKRTKRLK